jgi:hypothetical protein
VEVFEKMNEIYLWLKALALKKAVPIESKA